MKKNKFVLLAFCLFILTAMMPVAGSTGDGGSVTIVQPTEGAYPVGDTLTFSGTNTGSGTTYLFITGPNLNTKGSQIQSTCPHDSPVTDGDASTFLAISGFAGNTWLWEWNTKDVLIDAGTYTVYAASAPRDLPHVNSTHYATISFIMKRPADAPADTVTSTGSDASVTITRFENLRYYIGEDTITFSGTNTGSNTTYLLLSGPNLDAKGAQIQKDWPGKNPVTDGDATTFLVVGVGPDNRWSYTWDTHGVFIDSGMYTVYAASTPRDIPHINSTHSDRISFLMLPPKDMALRTAMEAGSAGGSPAGAAKDNLTSPSVVMHGDKITISGTAKGTPRPGVAIWIIGTPGNGTAGYANQFVVQPDSSGSYSLDLDSATVRPKGGKFYVVVQHPMQNNALDIYLASNTEGGATDVWVWNRMLKENNNANGTKLFKVSGRGSLQGDDAYEALIFAFKDPVVDDTITTPSSSTVTTTLPPVATVTSTGPGDNLPGQQDQVSETQNQSIGGQNKKTAGPGNLLDQVFGFLSGIF